ncbi:flavin reductase family protein [Arthrobacter sp. ATA002]|uniref:flavin reductase family protein n=1 Tax=Arthrobacter sp. ATA002 TaxID=2991715 RepID=UPI002E356BD5|nr:flavin reductase family protein [Arthrobacter sp. ATA002]
MTLLTDLQPAALRRAFSRFPSGVAALCAVIDGEPQGLVASSFTVGVSMDPPLVMFAVQNTSRTWPVLRGSGRIGVSILGAGHEGICRQIASKSGDRFAGLSLHTDNSGSLFLDRAALWLECSVEKEILPGTMRWYCCASTGMLPTTTPTNRWSSTARPSGT